MALRAVLQHPAPVTAVLLYTETTLHPALPAPLLQTATIHGGVREDLLSEVRLFLSEEVEEGKGRGVGILFPISICSCCRSACKITLLNL